MLYNVGWYFNMLMHEIVLIIYSIPPLYYNYMGEFIIYYFILFYDIILVYIIPFCYKNKKFKTQ